MSEFLAAGGINLGGQGEFPRFRPPGCDLVIVDDGLVTLLDVLTTKFGGGYRAGLFQNNLDPLQSTVLSEIDVCNFSGYQGLVLLTGWNAAVISGYRSDAQAHTVQWTHDGGLIGNWVYGYYVVDGGGILIWAQRFCPAPLLLDSQGQQVRLLPEFTFRNETGLEG